MTTTGRIPLSVLDLAPISQGSTARNALQDSLELARRAEACGYHRYWVAEHHFVATASSSPAVLIGLIASATQTIRVGSAAVQVGHQTPAAVVEAFGTLDALHPGRIDLGLGRSGQRRAEAATAGHAVEAPQEPTRVGKALFPVPFNTAALLQSERLTAAASVLQQPGVAVPDFGGQLDDILALLSGTFKTANGIQLSVRPGEGADVEVWLFGSSAGQSAQTAGTRGLPFVANYHASPGTTLAAIEAYRSAFRPAGTLDRPYVAVSADVLAAETDSEARRVAAPFGHWVYSIRSGHGAIAYPDPAAVEPLTSEQAALVEDRLSTRFVGAPAEVAEQLCDLQQATGAQELVLTTITHDPADRLRSFELLAREWF